MRAIFRSFIRTSAFLFKEFSQIAHDPRVLLTVIAAPFLILLVFGLGFKPEPPTFRALFVTEETDPSSNELVKYAQESPLQLNITGTTDNLDQAITRLEQEQIDVVVLFPRNPVETVQRNRQAVFTLYHNQLDPAMADYVDYFASLYVSEINERTLEELAEAGQQDAAGLEPELTEARESATALREALEAGDDVEATLQRARLEQRLNSLAFLAGATAASGAGNNQAADDQPLAALVQAQESASGLAYQVGSEQERDEQVAKVETIEEDLTIVENRLGELRGARSDVLVNPFRSETENLAPANVDPSDYFAPAVLALLLQHLAVTFAALSIVRERTTGSLEVLRVSPTTALETLFGKLLSYLLLCGLAIAATTVLAVQIVGVPFSGTVAGYALITVLVMLPALGYGFLISTLSHSDTLAVQLSMLLLLGTMVFSGFLIPLDNLSAPVRAGAQLLPATHAIRLLRESMLLGSRPDVFAPAVLSLLAIVTIGLSYVFLRREL